MVSGVLEHLVGFELACSGSLGIVFVVMMLLREVCFEVDPGFVSAGFLCQSLHAVVNSPV